MGLHLWVTQSAGGSPEQSWLAQPRPERRAPGRKHWGCGARAAGAGAGAGRRRRARRARPGSARGGRRLGLRALAIAAGGCIPDAAASLPPGPHERVWQTVSGRGPAHARHGPRVQRKTKPARGARHAARARPPAAGARAGGARRARARARAGAPARAPPPRAPPARAARLGAGTGGVRMSLRKSRGAGWRRGSGT